MNTTLDFATGDLVYMPIVPYGDNGAPNNSDTAGWTFAVYKDGDFSTAISPGGVSRLPAYSGQDIPASVRIDTSQSNGYVGPSESAFYTLVINSGTITVASGSVDLAGTIVGHFWLNRMSTNKDLVNDMFVLASDYLWANSVSGSVVRETGIGGGSSVSGLVDVYHARITCDFETGATPGTGDRYNIHWFKNGQPLLSGVTNQTVTIMDSVDHNNFGGAPTEIPNPNVPHVFQYKETVNLIAAGRKAIVQVEATIDALTRVFRDTIPNPD